MLYRVRKAYTVQWGGKWLSGGEVLDLTDPEYRSISHLLEKVPEEPKPESPPPPPEPEIQTQDVVMGTETNRALLRPKGRKGKGV
jgi:hypothetical protein